jgi:peptide deformylase
MLTVLQDGHKSLKKKAKRISKIDDGIKTLAKSMIDTMINSNGVGLSGNQVNVLKRIITILDKDIPKVFINPEIIEFSEEIETMEEGCLSFKNIYAPIPRYKEITIKYRQLDGKPKVDNYSGLSARIIQHEIDHLNGITFLERQ